MAWLCGGIDWNSAIASDIHTMTLPPSVSHYPGYSAAACALKQGKSGVHLVMNSEVVLVFTVSAQTGSFADSPSFPSE